MESISREDSYGTNIYPDGQLKLSRIPSKYAKPLEQPTTIEQIYQSPMVLKKSSSKYAKPTQMKASFIQQIISSPSYSVTVSGKLQEDQEEKIV